MEIGLSKNVEMGVDHEDTTLDDLSVINNVATGNSGELVAGDNIVSDSYLYDSILLTEVNNANLKSKIMQPSSKTKNLGFQTGAPVVNGNTHPLKGYDFKVFAGTGNDTSRSLNLPGKVIPSLNGQSLRPVKVNHGVNKAFLNGDDGESDMVTLTFEPAVNGDSYKTNRNNNNAERFSVSPNLSYITSLASTRLTKPVHNGNPMSRTKTFHASPDLSKSPNIVNYKSSIKNRLLAMEKFRVEQQNNHFKNSNTATSMLKSIVALKKAPEKSVTLTCIPTAKKPLQISRSGTKSVPPSRKRSYFGVSEHYFQYLNKPKRARHEPFQIIFKAHSLHCEISSTNAVKFPRASLSWPSGKVPLPGYKVPKRRIGRMDNISSSKKRRTVATYRVPKPKPRPAQLRHFSRNPAWGQRKVPNTKATNLLTLNTLKWDPSTRKFVLQSHKPVQKLQNKCQFFSFPSAISKSNAANLAQRSSKALFRAQNAHKVSKFLSQVIHNTATPSKPFIPKIPQNIKDVKNIFKCMHAPNPELYKSLSDYVRMCVLFHVRRQMAAKSLRSSYVEGKNKMVGAISKSDCGTQKNGTKPPAKDKGMKKEILNSIVLLSLQTEQILTKWTNELPHAKDIEKASVVTEQDKDKMGKATTSISCNWLYTCKSEYVEAPPSGTSHASGGTDDKLSEQARNSWSYDCVEVTKPVRNMEATKDSEETTKNEPAVAPKLQNGVLHNGNERSVICVNHRKHQKPLTDEQIHPKMQRSRSQVRTLSRDEGSVQKTVSNCPKPSYCVRFRSCFCPFRDEHYGKNCYLPKTSFPRITLPAQNVTDKLEPSQGKSVGCTGGNLTYVNGMPCTATPNLPTLYDNSTYVSTNGSCLLTKNSSRVDSHCLSNEIISLNGNECLDECPLNNYFEDYFGDVTEFRRKIEGTEIYYKWSVRRFSVPESRFQSPINYHKSFEHERRNNYLETVKRRVSADDRVVTPNNLSRVQLIDHKNMVKLSVGPTKVFPIPSDIPTACQSQSKIDDSKSSIGPTAKAPTPCWNQSKIDDSRSCMSSTAKAGLKCSSTDVDGTNNSADDDDVEMDSSDSEDDADLCGDSSSKSINLEGDEMDSKMLDTSPYFSSDQLSSQHMEEETTIEELEGNKLFFSFNSSESSAKIQKDLDLKTVSGKPVVCEPNALHCEQNFYVSCLYTAGKRLMSTMAKSQNNISHNGIVDLRKTTVGDNFVNNISTTSRAYSCEDNSFMKAPLDSGKPRSVTRINNNVAVDAGLISSPLIGVNLTQGKHTKIDDAEQNSLVNGVPRLDPLTQRDDETGASNAYYKDMGNKLFRANVLHEVTSADVTNEKNLLDVVDSDAVLTDIGNKVCCEEIDAQKMGIENHLTVGKGRAVDLCDELDTSGFGFNGKSSLRRLVKEVTTGEAKLVCQSDVENSLLNDTLTKSSVFESYKVKPESEQLASVSVANKFSESKLNEDTKENVIETITQNTIEAERIASGDCLNDTPLETRSSHRLRSRVSKKRGRYETDYVTDLPKTAKKPKRILPTRDYSNDEFWQFYRDCEKTERAKNLSLQHKYVKLIKSKEANCQVLPRFAAQSQYSNIICASASLNNSRNVVPGDGIMPFMSRHTRLKKGSVQLATASDQCPYCGRWFTGDPKSTYDSHVARHDMRYAILSAPILTSSLKKIQSKAAKKAKYARKDPKRTRTESATTVVYVDSMSKDFAKSVGAPSNNTWTKISPEPNKLINNIPKTSNISMGHRKQTARKSFNLTATLPKEALIATLQCKMRLSSPPADSTEPGSSVFNFQETSSLNANPVTLPKCPPLQLPKKKLSHFLNFSNNDKLHTKTNHKGKAFQSCSKYSNKAADIKLPSVNNVVKPSYCKANDTNKKGPKSPINSTNISLIRNNSNDKTCNGKIRDCKRKLSNSDQTQDDKKLRLENHKVCLSRKNSKGK